MSEPTAQELRLAALLHEADADVPRGTPIVFCAAWRPCAGPTGLWHLAQARALIALGVRVETDALALALEAEWYNGKLDEDAYRRLSTVAAVPRYPSAQHVAPDSADLDWRDQR